MSFIAVYADNTSHSQTVDYCSVAAVKTRKKSLLGNQMWKSCNAQHVASRADSRLQCVFKQKDEKSKACILSGKAIRARELCISIGVMS